MLSSPEATTNAASSSAALFKPGLSSPPSASTHFWAINDAAESKCVAPLNKMSQTIVSPGSRLLLERKPTSIITRARHLTYPRTTLISQRRTAKTARPNARFWRRFLGRKGVLQHVALPLYQSRILQMACEGPAALPGTRPFRGWWVLTSRVLHSQCREIIYYSTGNRRPLRREHDDVQSTS